MQDTVENSDSKKVSFYMNIELKRQFQLACVEDDLNMSKTLETLIEVYLEARLKQRERAKK